ncbi:hypothetical protein SCYAM73S_02711 [Streptomyces cyaneofuscatus]
MADYHHGELAVQHRAGLRDPAAGSLRAIRDAVPDAAAVFLARQPMIVIGAADASGRLWSTLLTGEPGLLGVPDPKTLTIGALPAPDDPLGAALREPGTRVGMIAIEPATRRRIRLNGTSVPEADGVRVALDQVIGNCPKYLQKREYALLPPDRGGRRTVVRKGEALTTVQQLHPRHLRQLLHRHRLPGRRRGRLAPGRQPGLLPGGLAHPAALARLRGQCHVPHPRQPRTPPTGRPVGARLGGRRPPPALRHRPHRLGRSGGGPPYRARSASWSS